MAEKTASEKTSPAKGTSTKKKVTKGDAYTCGVCGIVVTVDETCGCVDVCDIVCCGQPMKEKRIKAKAAATK